MAAPPRTAPQLAGAAATNSAPSAKEQAGALLRASFSDRWYDVDATLKEQRISWAYGVVRSAGYEDAAAARPRPPATLYEKT